MPMTAAELLDVHSTNTGHAGINSLFSKAHSMDWDIDRDVDWSLEVRRDDPCVDLSWSSLGRTPTFGTLPREVQVALTRSELLRSLNVLQVGESVAQDVCAKLALLLEPEDYRNHAVAQAMDEARHHLAYARFIEKMGEDPGGLDAGTGGIFDMLLQSDDPTMIVTTLQFFLESQAMALFEGLMEKATHPLLRDISALIRRDEARHVAFGVLYVSQHLDQLDDEGRLAYARAWLPRMVETRGGAGPRMLARVTSSLLDAGADDAKDLAQRMIDEQAEINAEERRKAAAGRRVPHVLRSARRAGLLAPDIVQALDLADHPLITGALKAPEEAD